MTAIGRVAAPITTADDLICIKAMAALAPKISMKGVLAMTKTPESSKRRERLADLAQAMLRWVRKFLPPNELDRCDRAEVERIARDVGVTEYELRALAAGPAGPPELLKRRLASLHLDTGRIQTAVLRDLQKHCAMCASKKRCAGDLEVGTLGSTWQDYCPNAYTLRAIIAAAPEPSTIEELLIYLNTVGEGAPVGGKSDSIERRR